MSDMRKCFSYNRDGQRCMQLADHEGNHAVAIEWTDEESWTPDMLVQVGPPVEYDSTMSQIQAAEALWESREARMDTEALALVEATPTPLGGPCVACSHQHQSGKCRCGCETYIPRSV